MQTDLPVVLFGAKYWMEVINWQALADSGTINQRDIDELLFTGAGGGRKGFQPALVKPAPRS
jgi:hypothetical protein